MKPAILRGGGRLISEEPVPDGGRIAAMAVVVVPVAALTYLLQARLVLTESLAARERPDKALAV